MAKTYDTIENLCGIDSTLLNDYCKILISKGIRKTGEKFWIIKKHLKNNKILLEHYFDVFEVNPIQNFKINFIIHHNKNNIPQIAFLGAESVFDWHKNIRYGKDNRPFVFTLEKNSAGNYTVHDEKGNKIHYKNSRGFEEWRQYDEQGNKIHYKDSDGFKVWYQYDEQGNKIHYKNSRGHSDLKTTMAYFVRL